MRGLFKYVLKLLDQWEVLNGKKKVGRDQKDNQASYEMHPSSAETALLKSSVKQLCLEWSEFSGARPKVTRSEKFHNAGTHQVWRKCYR